jgi:hypothetical protein
MWGTFDDKTHAWLLVQSLGVRNEDFDPKTLRNGWGATLYIVARDLPDLMRNGFHWDESNINHGRGYMKVGTASLRPCLRRIYANSPETQTRYYHLEDRSPQCRWFGVIEVTHYRMDELQSFDVSCITPDRVHQAIAWNPQDEEVFFFHAEITHKNYNAVLARGTPMKGFWHPALCGVSNTEHQASSRPTKCGEKSDSNVLDDTAPGQVSSSSSSSRDEQAITPKSRVKAWAKKAARFGEKVTITTGTGECFRVQ